MCKYCKHLEEERNLLRGDYQRVVDECYETVNKLMRDIQEMLKTVWIGR